MELQTALAVGVVALALVDVALIVVCARVGARVEEMRKALAAPAGQHEGIPPALETTTGAAGPDAREKKLPPRPYSLATQAAVRSKAEAVRRARHERERIAAQQGGPA